MNYEYVVGLLSFVVVFVLFCFFVFLVLCICNSKGKLYNINPPSSFISINSFQAQKFSSFLRSQFIAYIEPIKGTLFNILLVILFIDISTVITLPSFPSTNPLFPLQCLYKDVPAPAHPLLPQHTSIPLPILGHLASTVLRYSHHIDVRQGHPLLHMGLELWVPPCVCFGWWFSPWELCWGGGLVG